MNKTEKTKTETKTETKTKTKTEKKQDPPYILEMLEDKARNKKMFINSGVIVVPFDNNRLYC